MLHFFQPEMQSLADNPQKEVLKKSFRMPCIISLATILPIGGCSEKKTVTEYTSALIYETTEPVENLSYVGTGSKEGGAESVRTAVINDFLNTSIATGCQQGWKYRIYFTPRTVSFKDDVGWVKDNLEMVNEGTCTNLP
jgi:hypothetical protein